MANSRDVKLNLAVGTTRKDATPGVKRLAAELTALEQKTKDLRTAESAGRAEVGLQKAARADLVDMLARLKAETDKAGKASADYAVRRTSTLPRSGAAYVPSWPARASGSTVSGLPNRTTTAPRIGTCWCLPRQSN